MPPASERPARLRAGRLPAVLDLEGADPVRLGLGCLRHRQNPSGQEPWLTHTPSNVSLSGPFAGGLLHARRQDIGWPWQPLL
jgi:hypothetical protein